MPARLALLPKSPTLLTLERLSQMQDLSSARHAGPEALSTIVAPMRPGMHTHAASGLLIISSVLNFRFLCAPPPPPPPFLPPSPGQCALLEDS